MYEPFLYNVYTIHHCCLTFHVLEDLANFTILQFDRLNFFSTILQHFPWNYWMLWHDFSFCFMKRAVITNSTFFDALSYAFCRPTVQVTGSFNLSSFSCVSTKHSKPFGSVQQSHCKIRFHSFYSLPIIVFLNDRLHLLYRICLQAKNKVIVKY